MIAGWYCKSVNVGFYDSQSNVAVNYITEQTEISTIFCSDEYMPRFIEMKKQGLCSSVKNVVNFDNKSDMKDDL